MPSWEEIVQWVTIESNYVKVHESAHAWQSVFNQTDGLKAELIRLRDGINWKGTGASAFKEHLTQIIAALEKTTEEHRPMVDGLTTAAGALKTAVASIPIPASVYADIEGMREAHHSARFDTTPLAPGWFAQRIQRDFPSWTSWWESWWPENEERARAAFKKLGEDYRAIQLPPGTRVTAPQVGAAAATSIAAGAGKGGTGAAKPSATTPPLLQASPFGNQMATNPFGTNPTTSNPSVADPPDSQYDPPDMDDYVPPALADYDSGLDTEPWDATKLAGVGGGGFGGGIGGGGGLPPMGPAVGMPAGVVPGDPAGSLTGRAGQAASGVGAGGMGMVPMTGGGMAGQGEGQGGIGSKLAEDDPRRVYGLTDADDLPGGAMA